MSINHEALGPRSLCERAEGDGLAASAPRRTAPRRTAPRAAPLRRCACRPALLPSCEPHTLTSSTCSPLLTSKGARAGAEDGALPRPHSGQPGAAADCGGGARRLRVAAVAGAPPAPLRHHGVVLRAAGCAPRRRCSRQRRRRRRRLPRRHTHARARAREPARHRLDKRPPPNNKHACKQQHTTKQSTKRQLKELDAAVDRAAANPQRFNVTSDEAAARRKWVAGSRRAVDAMLSTLDTAAAASKGAAGAAAAAGGGGKGGAAAGGGGGQHDAFLGDELARQQLIVRQQDAELEDIEQAVTRLGRVGLTIHEELESQVGCAVLYALCVLCAVLWSGAACACAWSGAVRVCRVPARLSTLKSSITITTNTTAAATIIDIITQSTPSSYQQHPINNIQSTTPNQHQQGRILDELDEDVDTTHSRLRATQKKVCALCGRCSRACVCVCLLAWCWCYWLLQCAAVVLAAVRRRPRRRALLLAAPASAPCCRLVSLIISPSPRPSHNHHNHPTPSNRSST